MPETLKIEGKNLLKRLNANSDVYLKILYEIWSKAIKNKERKIAKKEFQTTSEHRQSAYHVKPYEREKLNALNIIHQTKTKYCFLFFDFQFMMHPVESQGRGSKLMPKWKSEQLLGFTPISLVFLLLALKCITFQSNSGNEYSVDIDKSRDWNIKIPF